MFEKVKLILKIVFNLPYTVFFNFYYLPFKQAIKLPILLFNPKILNLKGSVRIESDKIKFGMIQLGRWIVSLNGTGKEGIIWDHRGICIFKGCARIGNGGAISTGNRGRIEFGDDFLTTAGFKVASYESISFGEHFRGAWDVIVVDTDFHETISIDTGKRSTMTKPIEFGNNNWVGMKSIVLKGTKTPDYCIAGACSLVNKEYDLNSYSVISGIPAKFKFEGIYRDIESFVE